MRRLTGSIESQVAGGLGGFVQMLKLFSVLMWLPKSTFRIEILTHLVVGVLNLVMKNCFNVIQVKNSSMQHLYNAQDLFCYKASGRTFVFRPLYEDVFKLLNCYISVFEHSSKVYQFFVVFSSTL